MSDTRPPADRTSPLGSSTGPIGAGTGPTGTPPATSGKGAQDSKTSKTSRSVKGTGDDPLRRSRTSGLWFGVIAAGLLLILLIIFIVQNTQAVRVDFLGWSGTPPLAVALLVAAAAGILVTGLIGSLRILQLRRRIKRAAK